MQHLSFGHLKPKPQNSAAMVMSMLGQVSRRLKILPDTIQEMSLSFARSQFETVWKIFKFKLGRASKALTPSPRSEYCTQDSVLEHALSEVHSQPCHFLLQTMYCLENNVENDTLKKVTFFQVSACSWQNFSRLLLISSNKASLVCIVCYLFSCFLLYQYQYFTLNFQTKW